MARAVKTKKPTIATVAEQAGVAVGAGDRLLGALLPSRRLADWLAGGAMVPLGVGVYGVTLWALRIEGREDLAAVLARMRGKRSGG